MEVEVVVVIIVMEVVIVVTEEGGIVIVLIVMEIFSRSSNVVVVTCCCCCSNGSFAFGTEPYLICYFIVFGRKFVDLFIIFSLQGKILIILYLIFVLWSLFPS